MFILRVPLNLVAVSEQHSSGTSLFFYFCRFFFLFLPSSGGRFRIWRRRMAGFNRSQGIPPVVPRSLSRTLPSTLWFDLHLNRASHVRGRSPHVRRAASLVALLDFGREGPPPLNPIDFIRKCKFRFASGSISRTRSR